MFRFFVFVAPVFSKQMLTIQLFLQRNLSVDWWGAGRGTAVYPKCECNQIIMMMIIIIVKDIRTHFIFTSIRELSLTLWLIEKRLEGFCTGEDMFNGKDTSKRNTEGKAT